ncbi:DUF1569 domain-containing protein [Winogradskyella sp.]|jgi:hypothetical protein|uniref:DUF1569 domain-containing protein n=1 Tax=Winogradskyella sp. TaxID=1883156 RepID=UPI0025D4399D|nr:DUF1569 domain-containing protein [Winogradskyella sp.]MCT4630756.1 DUF1569 domain-containing protein [Winogradskyella sp.]
MKHLNKLFKTIDKLESFVPYFERENSKISKSTIGWQIDHSFKVINGVIEVLKTAPITKKEKLSLIGRFCLAFSYIPRGKGKAPKTVLPPKTISKQEILKQLILAKEGLNSIASVHPKATFKHAIFGVLSKATTLKFLVIHTKHHIKIIEDILNK